MSDAPEPLDPAAIMAEHEQHPLAGKPWCDVCMTPAPCLPYRLAAELAAERERSQNRANA